jgi:hypothetical protein
LSEENNSSTAGIAASVIAESEAASAPADYNAGDFATLASEHPWILAEIEQNGNDDLSKPAESPTRRAAAIAVGAYDPREFVRTKEGFVRRDYEPSNFTGAVAAEIADSMAAFQARGGDIHKRDTRKTTARAAHDFAASVNASDMETSLPIGGQLAAPGSPEWHAAADAVIDRIVEKVRERREKGA